jgi:MFS family permease
LPALASAGFRRYLAGALIGSIGSWMQATAQGWLVLALTNSPQALGVISAISQLPILLLSVVAGVIADRVDRRLLLVGTQVFAAMVALALALLATTGTVAFWHVAVLAALAGVAVAVQTPAYQAIVSTLVEPGTVGSAVALNSAQYNLSRIIGPSLAGAVIAAGGLYLAFWGNAIALFLVAAVFLSLPKGSPSTLARVQASMWSNLLDGVRYVLARRVIAALVLLAGLPALLLLNYLVLLPVYARDVLGIGAAGLGLLSASIGVGALAGALGFAVLRPSGGSGRALLGSLVVAGVAEAVFAWSRAVPVSVVALGVLGACQVGYYATTNTLVQVLVPPRLRGRVMSLYILTSTGLIPLGNLAAGVIAERTSPTLAVGAGALLTTLGALAVAAFVPELRRLGSSDAMPSGDAV